MQYCKTWKKKKRNKVYLKVSVLLNGNIKKHLRVLERFASEFSLKQQEIENTKMMWYRNRVKEQGVMGIFAHPQFSLQSSGFFTHGVPNLWTCTNTHTNTDALCLLCVGSGYIGLWDPVKSRSAFLKSINNKTRTHTLRMRVFWSNHTGE